MVFLYIHVSKFVGQVSNQHQLRTGVLPPGGPGFFRAVAAPKGPTSWRNGFPVRAKKGQETFRGTREQPGKHRKVPFNLGNCGCF